MEDTILIGLALVAAIAVVWRIAHNIRGGVGPFIDHQSVSAQRKHCLHRTLPQPPPRLRPWADFDLRRLYRPRQPQLCRGHPLRVRPLAVRRPADQASLQRVALPRPSPPRRAPREVGFRWVS